uniref:Uncharacterized protein n=1 Tax=Palpitomonas bilix TaxID=652834 RepID=A0A7S3DBC5_9EUKA|mmetsp:Transcript_30075/g.77588  ORF Transcript_30075/g.77588 Transcript_30075/m.77588 type:complete len:420 (+) Transcript_30075:516-1775(+)
MVRIHEGGSEEDAKGEEKGEGGARRRDGKDKKDGGTASTMSGGSNRDESEQKRRGEWEEKSRVEARGSVIAVRDACPTSIVSSRCGTLLGVGYKDSSFCIHAVRLASSWEEEKKANEEGGEKTKMEEKDKKEEKEKKEGKEEGNRWPDLPLLSTLVRAHTNVRASFSACSHLLATVDPYSDRRGIGVWQRQGRSMQGGGGKQGKEVTNGICGGVEAEMGGLTLDRESGKGEWTKVDMVMTSSDVDSVAFSPSLYCSSTASSQWVIAGCDEGEVVVWSVKMSEEEGASPTLHQVQMLNVNRACVYGLAFSAPLQQDLTTPAGCTSAHAERVVLATADTDGCICMWSLLPPSSSLSPTLPTSTSPSPAPFTLLQTLKAEAYISDCAVTNDADVVTAVDWSGDSADPFGVYVWEREEGCIGV